MITLIHAGINDILQSKDMSELKDLSKKIMQIGTTCQSYNIGKVYVSSICCRRELPLTSVKLKNNLVFINHQNITNNDLWADDIHLKNSEKVILARDFAEKVDTFLI